MARARSKKTAEAGMQDIYRSLESGQNKIQAKQISAQQVLLELEEGSFNAQEAWFVKDEQDQKFVVIPEVLLQHIVRVIQRAYEDKVMVELERDMASLTPIDFADAMAVVFKKLEGLRGKDGSLPKISSLDFVKQIKKQHPNLFFNLPEFLESKRQELDLDISALPF
ncbi:DUF2603 domain-containing protein [Helicobacter gastrocanis]|nr:DUF2603 domain-containing protein [Helicobacter sp. NHP19-003]